MEFFSSYGKYLGFFEIHTGLNWYRTGGVHIELRKRFNAIFLYVMYCDNKFKILGDALNIEFLKLLGKIL